MDQFEFENLQIRHLPPDLAKRLGEKIRDLWKLKSNPRAACAKEAENLPPHLKMLCAREPLNMLMFEAGFVTAIETISRMFEDVQRQALESIMLAEKRRMPEGEGE